MYTPKYYFEKDAVDYIESHVLHGIECAKAVGKTYYRAEVKRFSDVLSKEYVLLIVSEYFKEYGYKASLCEKDGKRLVKISWRR